MSKNIPVKRNIKQKTCTKCGELKSIRNFHKRSKKKKNGEAMYLSSCKVCNLAASKKKQCECGKMISKSAKYCASCAAMYRKGPNTGKVKNSNIDPKWLTRGKVSSAGGSGHTQFTQE